MKMSDHRLKMISAKVPRQLAQDFADAAKQEERSVSAALRLAMRRYLADAERKA